MADQPTKIRDVAWSELFPWLILMRAVRIALLARVLVLGAAGLLATMLGWWLIAGVFSRSSDPVITTWSHANGLAVWAEVGRRSRGRFLGQYRRPAARTKSSTRPPTCRCSVHR